MQITNVIGSLPRKGTQDSAHPIGSITKIIVHHDAQWRGDNYDSVARYKAQANYHIGRGEDGLQYHYKIDNVGEVFQCRNLTDTLWHAANYPVNRASIAICLDGDFTQQEPTREQYEALRDLLVELCTKHPEFPADQNDVFGHSEVSQTGTACPGRILNFVKSFRSTGGNTSIPNVPMNNGQLRTANAAPIVQPVIPPVPATPPAPEVTVITTPPAPFKGEEESPVTIQPEIPDIPETPQSEETTVQEPVDNTSIQNEEKETEMESKKFTLNKADLLKIAKGAGIALVGALGAYLLTLTGVIEMGTYTPFVAGALSVIANAMIKFAAGK